MNKFFLRNKAVVLIGGSGQLGRQMVQKFRAGGPLKRWKVFNIDLEENSEAQANFIIDPSKPIQAKQLDALHEQLDEFDEEFDAIMNLAGLWYPPNNNNYKRLLSKENSGENDNSDGNSAVHHPFSVSSVKCFENYQKI